MCPTGYAFLEHVDEGYKIFHCFVGAMHMDLIWQVYFSIELLIKGESIGNGHVLGSAVDIL